MSGTPEDPSGGDDRRIEPENTLPETSLEELPERVREACGRAGWSALMPVQAHGLPYLLAGRDLMVQSRTGSGKTGAFLLPLLERLDPDNHACQALILVPTRELAQQVTHEAETLLNDAGLRTIAVYGGTSYKPQLEAFRAGAPVVIGTPGRILDHLLRGSLHLRELRVLVFDEADRMLSMGFFPDMQRIKQHLPARPRSNWLFSATYPPHVHRLAGIFLSDPEMLSLSTDHVHVADTEHAWVVVPALQKDRALIRLIELENPSAALIFCNTKRSVEYVSAVLRNFGYDADALSADLGQKARDRVLDRVRRGELRLLVATDVAARGIDIPDLSHVFQFEPPEDPEAYVHRAGRTGRAGATGTAITLTAGIEEMQIRSIFKHYGIRGVERKPPDDDEIATLLGQRLTATLEARYRALKPLERERTERFVPLARQLAQIEDEAVLIAMLLDEDYRRALQAPPAAGVDEGPDRERPRDRDGDGWRGQGGGGGRKRGRRRGGRDR